MWVIFTTSDNLASFGKLYNRSEYNYFLYTDRIIYFVHNYYIDMYYIPILFIFRYFFFKIYFNAHVFRGNKL